MFYNFIVELKSIFDLFKHNCSFVGMTIDSNFLTSNLMTGVAIVW